MQTDYLKIFKQKLYTQPIKNIVVLLTPEGTKEILNIIFFI